MEERAGHFGEHANYLSWQELDEKIDSKLVTVHQLQSQRQSHLVWQNNWKRGEAAGMTLPED